MPEFFTTRGISYQLENIIKEAKEKLYLISPYLRITQDLKELLENKPRNLTIQVIYGKSELRPDQAEWLEKLEPVRTSYRNNLHAKCYLNENTVLLTSMNLYEFSEKSNYEMGILVRKEKDPELYDDIFQEVQDLVNNSEGISVTVTRDDASKPDRERPAAPRTPAVTQDPTTGVCIRCENQIPANAGRPYCNKCFASWNRFKNDWYEEGHCHACGKEATTSMAKPVCPACFSKHRKWVAATTA